MLRQSYEKQTLTLQNFYLDSHLKYDASGALISTGHPGSWTLGYVAIDSVKLTDSQLELRSKRVAAQVQTESNQVLYIRENENVHIDIAAPPAADEATLRGAIERIFCAPNTNFAPFLPDY